METLQKTTEMVLAEAGIKGLYPQLFARIDELVNAADAELEPCFSNFLAELESDFAMEERWMEEIGFAGLREHREKHADLLRLLHHAQARAIGGDLSLARKLGKLLAPWFTHHISTMDVSWATASQDRAVRESQDRLALQAA